MVNERKNPRPEPHIDGADNDDELLARMQAARPIDPNPQPRSDGPQAQALLESLMNNQPNQEVGPAAAASSAADGRTLDNVLFADSVNHNYERPTVADNGRGRKGYGLILAAAAAVVVLVAGALALLPANTEPALAAVQSAAQATAEAQTGRVEVVAALDGNDDAGSGSIDGSVTGRYDGANVSFTVGEFSAVGEGDAEGEFEDFTDELPLTETRFVDGVLYANTVDDGWLGVEVPDFVGSSIAELADPREVLGSVQDLVEAEEVGPETLTEPNGATVDTVHYRSVVDLGDETLGESGWLTGMDLADLDAEGQVTIDIYVGADNLLRRLTVSGDLNEADGGTGAATFEIVSSFYDIGGDITVEAPADAEIIDPMADFDFEDEGSFFEDFEELEELDG